ncbi:MAG: ABC transporter permease subunit [Pseudomonadota bacterium]
MNVAEQQVPGSLAARVWRGFTILLPYLWLSLFFLLPFLIVFKISLADPIVAQPPFTPLLDIGKVGWQKFYATLDSYRFLFEDNLYVFSYLKSIWIATVSTLLCLLIGYPMAYGIARARPVQRNILLMLVILPFWTSFLLRVYAWMGMLSTNGLINNALLALGLIDAPLKILYTDTAVYIGIVYSYLPFMILPLYAALERLDGRLIEAAYDLGASRVRAFIDVTLPLSRPGILAGCLLVFIPAMGEYVIPALLGGLDSLMIGRQLFNEFYANRDWPVAAAVATILLILLVVPMMWLNRVQSDAQGQS